MKVMIAIRRRGTSVPPTVNPKTSLGLGQGTVVDIRTVIYEIRNELKMNVSLRRKIHIIALPQGTFLNAADPKTSRRRCLPNRRAAGEPLPCPSARVAPFAS